MPQSPGSSQVQVRWQEPMATLWRPSREGAPRLTSCAQDTQTSDPIGLQAVPKTPTGAPMSDSENK
eukprot:2301939-Pyramimonas_sp.AAC.1